MKKVFLGVFLIVLAIVALGLGFFYQFVVKPELAVRRITKPKVMKKAVVNPPSPTIIPQKVPSEPQKTISEPPKTISEPQKIETAKPVQELKSIYGADLKQEREGVLWIDHASSKFTVTLGSVQGLSQGQMLSVYDGEAKVGQVTVETVSDVISYVRPAGDTEGRLKNDYYKVVIE